VFLPAAETGLPRDSVAVGTSIMTVGKRILTERVGSLRRQMLGVLLDTVSVVLGRR